MKPLLRNLLIAYIVILLLGLLTTLITVVAGMSVINPPVFIFNILVLLASGALFFLYGKNAFWSLAAALAAVALETISFTGFKALNIRASLGMIAEYGDSGIVVFSSLTAIIFALLFLGFRLLLIFVMARELKGIRSGGEGMPEGD